MTTLRRCIELLDRHRIRYTHTRHANAYRARDVAVAEQVPSHRVAKTVVFCGDNIYSMAVLSADCLLDLDELSAALGIRRVRLVTEGELIRLFPDSEVGAMPPFGALFNLPVYLDERLAREKYIVFNAGTHRDAIHMRMADYMDVATPLVVRLACPESAVSCALPS
jgi:Ala-tRNA(Pro) deacylase